MTEESLTVSIPNDDEALLGQCRVETFRAGGPGGQHQNTTESGVRIIHIPTGVRATARDERSQFRTRSIALKRLRARLEAFTEVLKPRKPPKHPYRANKRKRLKAKRKRSDTKRLRKPPKPEE